MHKLEDTHKLSISNWTLIPVRKRVLKLKSLAKTVNTMYNFFFYDLFDIWLSVFYSMLI